MQHHGIILEPAHYLTPSPGGHRFAEAVRHTFPTADVEGMLERWAEQLMQLARQGKVPVKPGYTQLAAVLKATGVKRAIVTANDCGWVSHYLEALHANDNFDLVITAHDVGNRLKPMPDAYLLAASKLGADPSRCFVLEDSTIGIEAALNAGMLAGWVQDLAPVSAQTIARCTACFDGLASAATYLEKLLSGGLLCFAT